MELGLIQILCLHVLYVGESNYYAKKCAEYTNDEHFHQNITPKRLIAA